MSHRRSSFERAYADGVLGNIEQQLGCKSKVKYVQSIPSQLTQNIMHQATDYVSYALELRKQQALVDILIRKSTVQKQNKKICAPHLPHEFRNVLPRTNQFLNRPFHHFNVLTKQHLSLAESLYYAMHQCSSDTYHGVLMPYHVNISDSDADHANMIYLHFQHTAHHTNVQCYLLEPNGVGFTHKYPNGLANLKRAWEYLCRQTMPCTVHFTLQPIVRVFGDQIGDTTGLQTYLGSFREQRTLKIGRALQTSVSRSGYGICGAVTFWLFCKWLRSTKPYTLEEYYTKLLEKVKKNRIDSQKSIMHFIKDINQKVKQQYATLTKAYIDKDFETIQIHLHKKYTKLLQSRHCSLNLHFTIQLGTGKVWLLQMNREIALG